MVLKENILSRNLNSNADSELRFMCETLRMVLIGQTKTQKFL